MDDYLDHKEGSPTPANPNYMEGLVGSMGLASEINSLKAQIQELQKGQEQMLPIKGIVDAFSEVFTDHTQEYESQLAQWANDMEDMKKEVADVHRKLAEISDNRNVQDAENNRKIDELNDCIQSISHDYERNALEVEDGRRELAAEIDKLQQYIKELREEDTERFEKVWEATQCTLSTVEDTSRQMTQQASEWEEFRDEATNDFEKLRKLVDYLLTETFADVASEKQKALTLFSAPGEKTFGEKIISGAISPASSALQASPTRDQIVMMQPHGRTPDVTMSQVVDLEARLNGAIERLQQDVNNLADDCQRLQKDRGDFLSRIGDLENGGIKQQHIENLRNEINAQEERLRNDEQELRTLAAQVTTHRQELNEVQQRHERHSAEIQSKLSSHSNSLTDYQSQLRKELQSNASDLQGHWRKELQSHALENQAQLRRELQSLTPQWRKELESQKTEIESSVALPVQIVDKVDAATTEVDGEVDKRLDGLIEQVNSLVAKDFVTKQEFEAVTQKLWDALAQGREKGGASGGDELLHKTLKEEIAKNHEMVWEAVLQLQMKQNEQNRVRKPDGTPLGDGRISGTGGTPTRSGNATPTRVQRIETVQGMVAQKLDANGLLLTRSSSRPVSPMTPNGNYAPRIVTQQLPLQGTVTSIGSPRANQPSPGRAPRANQPSPGRVIQSSPRVAGYASSTIAAKPPGSVASYTSAQGS